MWTIWNGPEKGQREGASFDFIQKRRKHGNANAYKSDTRKMPGLLLRVDEGSKTLHEGTRSKKSLLSLPLPVGKKSEHQAGVHPGAARKNGREVEKFLVGCREKYVGIDVVREGVGADGSRNIP